MRLLNKSRRLPNFPEVSAARMSNMVTFNSSGMPHQATPPVQTPAPQIEAARPKARLTALPKPVRAPAASGGEDSAPLSPPVELKASSRPPTIGLIATLARRSARLAMDAVLILVFAPVIAAWLLAERRRRARTQL